MARTAITLQKFVPAGLAATYAAANVDGNAIDNTDGDVLIHVKNADAAPITVTIPTPFTIAGLALPDQTVTVTNGTEKFIGPFKRNVFNSDDSGTTGLSNAVLINYSAVSNITVAAFRFVKE